MPRVSSRPRNGGGSCQPVIDHGTSPANVNGATTKKTAEPRTAMVRCTEGHDTRCELIQSSRHGFPSSSGCRHARHVIQKRNRARLKPECHGGNEAQG